jgi:uncharacterized protein
MPTLSVIGFASLVVAVAGFVRGYSGFGFSMIAVTSLSLVLRPAEIVPLVLLLEIIASAWLLPRIWRLIDWGSLKWLFLGVIIGTPAGVYLLASLPDRPMRIGIGVVVILLVILLRLGVAFKTQPGGPVVVVIGTVSGFLNGGAAIAGPPVILYYLSSPASAAVTRASLICFFLGTDVVAITNLALQGLLTSRVFVLLGLLLCPLLIGIGFGNRSFLRTDAEAFRRKVMVLLILVALLVIVRAWLM